MRSFPDNRVQVILSFALATGQFVVRATYEPGTFLLMNYSDDYSGLTPARRTRKANR